MFKALTHKPLWVNILAVVILVALLGVIFLGSLEYITQHGKYEKVPSIVGKTMDDAKKILEAKGFEVEIQDSLYIDTVPALSVIKQVPEGDATVKVNRTIYLTINRAQPPMIEMPNLIGFSIRNAEMYLENLGLHVGDTTFRPDIAKNAVLEQLYKGDSIKPGTKLYMGSAIDFVLGDGVGNTEMSVPNLIGKTYGEIKAMLKTLNINLTPVADIDVTDMNRAFVYRQNPEESTEPLPGQKFTNKIKAGQSIDVWLSVSRPVKDSAVINTPTPEPNDVE